MSSFSAITEVESKSRTIFRESSSVFAAQVMMLLSGVLNNFFVARLRGPDGKGFICYAIPRYGILGAATIMSLSYLLNASLYILIYARTASLTPRSLVLIRATDLAWYRRLLADQRS